MNDPVCTCAGQTVENPCEATARGLGVAFHGECGGRCEGNADCPQGLHCRGSSDWGLGFCGPLPNDCGEDNAVCSRGGRDVANECEAVEQDIRIDPTHLGSCFACQPGECQCLVFDDCGNEPDDINYCDLPGDECEPDQVGVCRPGVTNVDRCMDILRDFGPDPVCGCDGVTYDLLCRAQRADVPVAHYGPCE